MSKQLVWLITGTSSGFGQRLARIVLARGDKVVATARSINKLQAIFPTPEDKLRLVELDVTSGFNTIRSTIDAAIKASGWGRVDVLVNNAGEGYLGLIEESGSAMLRRQFDINVFGVVDVTNAVLPYMRSQKEGTIVNIGSRSVWRSEVAGLGTYAASKAAIHAITSSLATEVASFNIRVLLLCPGAFRTEGMYSIPFNMSNPIPDYDQFRQTCRDRFAAVPGREPGDPQRAMEIVADIARGEGVSEGKTWPWCLLLGNDAEQDLNQRWKRHQGVFEEWVEVTRSVDLE